MTFTNAFEPVRLAAAKSTLAATLGLSELRSGTQRAHNTKRRGDRVIVVSKLWWVHISPSFRDHAVLAVVRTESNETAFRSRTSSEQAGIAIYDQGAEGTTIAAVARIEADPLPAALAQVELLATKGGFNLNGIAYELHTHVPGMRARIDFANPTTPGLRAAESAFLDVAKQIAEERDISQITDYIASWRDDFVSKRLGKV